MHESFITSGPGLLPPLNTAYRDTTSYNTCSMYVTDSTPKAPLTPDCDLNIGIEPQSCTGHHDIDYHFVYFSVTFNCTSGWLVGCFGLTAL